MPHHTTLVQRCRAANSLLAGELAAEFRRLENDRSSAANKIEALVEALLVFVGPVEIGAHMTDVPNDSPVTIRCHLGDTRRARAAITKATGAKCQS